MKLPHPGELAPELEQLRAKEADLSRRAAPLRAERMELISKLRDRDPTEEVPPPNAQAMRVAGLLGRDAPTVTASPRERLNQVERELADVDAALSLLGRDIAAAHRTASAKARAQADGEYRKRVAAVATALTAAHDANHALRAFVEGFEDAGFSSSGWSQLFPGLLGGHTDPNSPLAYYLRECVEAGMIAAGDIPPELRHA